jgi:diguanylate cyclase (GGDEF)-like protein/PAS domain S-box-containing protein
MIKITTIKCGFYWLLLSLAPAAVAFEHAFNINTNTVLIIASALLALALPYLLFVIYKLKRSRLQHSLSEKRLKSTVEGSGDMLWDWNIKTGEVIRINDKYKMDRKKLMGFEPHKILSTGFYPQKSAFFEATYRIKDTFGHWHWVLDRGKIIEKDANLAPLRMTGTVRDISVLKSTQERLNLFAKCVESLTDALAIYDKNFNLVDINPSFLTLFGGVREQYLKKPFNLPGYDKSYTENIKNIVRERERIQQEVKLRNSERVLLPIEISIDEIKNDQHQITNYVVVYSDLTERKNAQSQLHNLSNRDRTTSLPNRNLFFTDLQKLVKQNTHPAILLFDLDNYKKINESLGHQLGDSLLAKLAMRLNKLTRENDVFYRLGGDEFALVMADTNDIHVITRMAKQFLAAIATPFKMAGHELAITSSVGIVLFPEDGSTPELLLKNADTAMYHAKKKGNSYLFFNDTMNRQAVKRLQIENLMRFGLKENHFEVYYQPKMNIRTGKLTGMEALVRFITPKKGVISPGVFIPIAEETGQIIEIGEVVLNKACRDVKQWLDDGLFSGRVAVNLSAKQFSLPDLTTRIDVILQKNELPSYFLELEITEGTVMDDPQEAIAIMRSLSARGIHLAMDDFGTGYSSLAYLKQFPLNTLKVDKAFIDDMKTERGRNMVDSIVTIAQNLDLHVVAEGVEQASQIDILKTLNCETVQGYFYSKPLSKDEFTAFLKQQQSNSTPSLISANKHLAQIR